MADRPQIRPYPAIVNGDMSQATITSKVSIIDKLPMISYQVTWTGTSPVGTLAVQVSNDYTQDATGATANAGTWNSVTLEDSTGALVTSIPVSGNTGSQFIDGLETCGFAIRLLYTKASGTGTLNATFVSKVK